MPERRRAVSVRVGSSLLAASTLLGSFALPVAAVEPIVGTPLPDEPPATILPNLIMDALAFDVDADGVRELLTIGVAADAPGLAAVQVWWVAEDGSAQPSNQVHVRRSASVDELTSGQRGLLGIDRDSMIAVKIDEGTKLVVVERDGREVALVAAIGSNPDFVNRCCLTIWQIVLEAPGAVELRLVAATQNSAIELIAADMDADGTDELFVTEGPLSDLGAMLKVSLLRWNGTQYERTARTMDGLSSCCATILDAGETDGVAGADVLLSGPLVGPEGEVSAGLHRVSLRDGAPFLERASVREVGVSDATDARALMLESGPAIVTNSELGTLTLWSWPRGGQADRLFACGSGGVPAAVFGAGSDIRIVVRTSLPPGSVNVRPGDLGGGFGCPSTLVGRDTRGASFGGSFFGDEAPTVTPFYGVIPGGLPGLPEAYTFSGRLVVPVPNREILAEVRDISLLAGVEPMGLVGSGDAWVALLTEFNGFEPEPRTMDLLSAHTPATLRLVAATSVLDPEINGGNLEPTFLGVAPDPDHPSAFIVGNDAADAEIVGPPGTWVGWSTRGGFGEATVGPDGVERIRLLDEASTHAPDGSGTTVEIWVVTPAGHGYDGAWRIRVYREPPSLVISDDGGIVNLSPVIAGRTVPGATLTVNGFAVDVAANGTFEAPVMVGLLPTDVRVVATDPVGNRTEQVVSVVWPVDYRRLPFVPFAVLLTVAAALVLFLRRPDTGPTRRTPHDGATFEEIGD